MRILFFFIFILTQLYSNSQSISYFEQKEPLEKIDILNQQFIPLESKKTNFGFTKSIYWLKIELQNETAFNLREVIYFNYALLDYIDIYELQNEELVLQRETGDLREYVNDGFLSEPTYIVELASNKKKILLLRVQTQGSMNIGINVLDYEEFVSYGVTKAKIFMFYFGGVLIMLMYNFVLYLYLRDRAYLYYVTFHFVYMLFSLSYNGLAFEYFYEDFPSINNYAVPFLMSLGSTLAVAFVMSFLHIKENSLWVYKVLKSLVLINIVATLSVFVLPYMQATLLVSLLSFISVIIILASSIHSQLIVKNPNALFFSISWGFLLLGIFIVNLKSNAIISDSFFVSNASFIGAFIELVLLSSALAYRYKLQNEEIVKKDKALMQRSRHASMGEMIANIAHQWRQPLHRVTLSLSIIDIEIKDKEMDKELIHRKLRSSQENLLYMSNTIDDFSNYFKVDKQKSLFNIYSILESSKNLLESRLGGVTLVMPTTRDVSFTAYQNEYLQVVLVILNNALDNFKVKNTEKPTIIFKISSEKDTVTLEIEDNGGGIPEDIIDKIFDPYFTTKFKEEGTGIGLYMAKLLIEESMHGELSVSNTQNGTLFRVKNDKIP